MTVYIVTASSGTWHTLHADTDAELHNFAQKLDLPRDVRYGVSNRRRDAAIAAGAVPTSKAAYSAMTRQRAGLPKLADAPAKLRY